MVRRLFPGGRWIRTIGPPVSCELYRRGPPLLPARERERFSAISFLLSEPSKEPIAHVVWVGCGLSRCSAASAFRRYNSNTFAFHRLDQQFAERPYHRINSVR